MISLRNLIIERDKKTSVINGVKIDVSNPANKSISFKKIIKSVFDRLPKIFWKDLQSINVGNFKELQDRNLQAMYTKNKIFLSNEVAKEEDYLDDIIHEIAHHVETKYFNLIYADETIKKEFLIKRENVFNRLKHKGFDVNLRDFLNPKYDEKFDHFISQVVGYPTMRTISSDIFYSPYAITSLREYFANGFEAYYMKEEIPRLKNISPKLFKKILKLGELKDGKYV